MPNQKIDRLKLNQMLRNGKSQKEAAEFFGVSEAAISKARKELNINVVKNTALETAHKVAGENLDALAQLRRINEKANQMLDELTGEDRVIDRMVRAVEEILSPDTDSKNVGKIIKQLSRDRFLALKCMGEVRGQLNLQLAIFQTMTDLESVRQFQTEVLDAIAEVDKGVRDKIISRLKEKRALRNSVRIN